MEVIALMLPLMFGIMSLYNYKKIINMQVIFNILWFVVVFVSAFNILKTVPVRKEIFLMSILFTLVFNFGAIFGSCFYVEKKNVFSKTINDTFIKCCVVFVAIFYIILLYRASRYILNGGSLSEVRYEYFYGNSIIKNKWENIFNLYILNGIYNFLFLYLIYNIVHQGKISINLGIIALVFARVIFSAGRLELIELMVLLCAEMAMYWKTLDKKLKKTIFAIMLISIVGIVIISLKRNVTSLLKSAVAYFTSSMAFSSVVMDTYQISFIGFGRVVFAPFLDFFINMLRLFNLTDVYSASHLLSELTSGALVIGLDGSTFNALVPAYFHLYLGGGYFSIIVFGFIFGWICILAEKRFRINPSARNELLWMFLLVGVAFSSMGWRYTQVSVVITLFCIYYVERTNKTV